MNDVYPVVFLDAFVLKVKEGGSVQRKACDLALGVRINGERDVLGMWFQQTEGAKFWMQVLGQLKQRGVQDILICGVDGLTGFPKQSRRSSQKTTVQTCIVHLIRRSLRYVPRREKHQCRQGPQADLHRDRRGRRRAGARDLTRARCQAPTASADGAWLREVSPDGMDAGGAPAGGGLYGPRVGW